MYNALKVNGDEIMVFSRIKNNHNIVSYIFSDKEESDDVWISLRPLVKKFEFSSYRSGGRFPLSFHSFCQLHREKIKFDSEQIFLDSDELGDLYLLSFND